MYYYLEKSIRLEKTKVYSVFLGSKIPDKNKLKEFEKTLINKIYSDIVGEKENIYLTKEQLIESEIIYRRYNRKIKKLNKSQKDEKEEIETVNFVYTTLSTEGVPLTKQDAELAYKFSNKNIHNIRDENLKVSLDMIEGLRTIKESKKGISINFVTDLHNIIMGEYKDKHPGRLRKKQAYIFLRDYEKVEEIRFRPPKPEKIKNLLEELVMWYNLNVEKLNYIELAALLHLRFYMIHPFEDGNKRTSRLLLNKGFYDTNKPLLNISKDREKYFASLIKSVENKNEKPFVEFVLDKFVENCKKI